MHISYDAGMQDNYETGVDCGGNCKPCSDLLAFTLAVGNYGNALANSSAAYITYDRFLSVNESVSCQCPLGSGCSYLVDIDRLYTS